MKKDFHFNNNITSVLQNEMKQKKNEKGFFFSR